MTCPLDIIKEIREAKGKSKIDVIERHKNNDLLKEVVALAYNQLLSYNISKIDDAPEPCFLFGDAEPVQETTIQDGFQYLGFLNAKGSAGNAERKRISEIKAGMQPNDAALMDLIVARDLRCGASLSTFRKVYGKEFVPDFPCMLVSPYSAKDINKHIDWNNAYSQLKSDGARCSIMCYQEGIVMRSRNGKPYHGLTHLAETAKEYTEDLVDVVLDGELVVIDHNGVICSRQVGNGIINKASNGTISEEESSRVVFVVWDIIGRDEFEEQPDALPVPYNQRWHTLETLDGNCERNQTECGQHKRIKLTETRKVTSLYEAKLHYAEMIERGEEGTILKDGGSFWEPKRSNKMYKFKEEFPAEFKIVGWYHGKKGTKYETKIGGFNIESGCGMVTTGVGSGLTDAIRNGKPEWYIGKIVEIKYNHRTIKGGEETQSLFLPRVIEVRTDKTEADTLEKMIEQEAASRELKSILEN